MAKNTPRICSLQTPFDNVAQFSWKDYPLPQLKRDIYLSLCGSWQLAVKKYAVAISSMTPLKDWYEYQSGKSDMAEHS